MDSETHQENTGHTSSVIPDGNYLFYFEYFIVFCVNH